MCADETGCLAAVEIVGLCTCAFRSGVVRRRPSPASSKAVRPTPPWDARSVATVRFITCVMVLEFRVGSVLCNEVETQSAVG